MIGGIQFKVCGLTTLAAAECAAQCGADYLGFIFHPASPRFIPAAAYAAFAPHLPPGRRVAVSVEPDPASLAEQQAAGFDLFQIHFRAECDLAQIAAWSKAVGPERLWLAPRLPTGAGLNEAWLPLARGFLLDGYQADKFGGTGLTGDWPAFARRRTAHPKHTWILSGGLNAANIGAALRATGARHVDVNSGVESSPGVKDPEKLRAFAAALAQAQTKQVQ